MSITHCRTCGKDADQEGRDIQCRSNPYHTVVLNVRACSICQAPADLIDGSRFQCRADRCHFGDTMTGIITDHTRRQDDGN